MNTPHTGCQKLNDFTPYFIRFTPVPSTEYNACFVTVYE